MAFNDLQSALKAAAPGDEIWVARGRYLSTTVSSNREATFALVEGTALYGGFNGTETTRDQREWSANRTILSGDIDNNDTTDPDGVVLDVEDIVGGNSYNVVTAVDLSEETVLDWRTRTSMIESMGRVLNLPADSGRRRTIAAF
jgi:hypothetical protein